MAFLQLVDHLTRRHAVASLLGQRTAPRRDLRGQRHDAGDSTGPEDRTDEAATIQRFHAVFPWLVTLTCRSLTGSVESFWRRLCPGPIRRMAHGRSSAMFAVDQDFGTTRRQCEDGRQHAESHLHECLAGKADGRSNSDRFGRLRSIVAETPRVAGRESVKRSLFPMSQNGSSGRTPFSQPAWRRV